jgi:hypothetical protein
VNNKAENRKRLISITEGNLRNHHLYITECRGFFPKECRGQSSAKKGTGQKLTLVVEGLSDPIETDIAGNGKNEHTRNFFRKRAWVGQFIEKHQLQAGDVIAIERVNALTYHVYPLKPRNWKRCSGDSAHARYVPLRPSTGDPAVQNPPIGFGDTAFTKNRQEPLHRWVPWIAGFSASFVQEVLDVAVPSSCDDVTILDPFAGVGTTLVEGLKRGYDVIGFEINPYAALACEVKVSCIRHKLGPLGEAITRLEDSFSQPAYRKMTPKSSVPRKFKSRIQFFSPAVEREVLLLQDFIADQKDDFVRKVLQLTLGSVMVAFSNYSYEPSLSTRSAAGKDLIETADVYRIFRNKLREIEEDISLFRQDVKRFKHKPKAEIHVRSYLQSADVLKPGTVDVLVTSPPYLNNYHYVRNTRPQLY